VSHAETKSSQGFVLGARPGRGYTAADQAEARAYDITRTIKHRKLQRATTAGMLDVAPQKIANLRSYNLKNFSIEELVGLLASLTRNQDNGVLRR
jgi:predicted XRE-type DNA-binding protein